MLSRLAVVGGCSGGEMAALRTCQGAVPKDAESRRSAVASPGIDYCSGRYRSISVVGATLRQGGGAAGIRGRPPDVRDDTWGGDGRDHAGTGERGRPAGSTGSGAPPGAGGLLDGGVRRGHGGRTLYGDGDQTAEPLSRPSATRTRSSSKRSGTTRRLLGRPWKALDDEPDFRGDEALPVRGGGHPVVPRRALRLPRGAEFRQGLPESDEGPRGPAHPSRGEQGGASGPPRPGPREGDLPPDADTEAMAAVFAAVLQGMSALARGRASRGATRTDCGGVAAMVPG